MNTKEKRLRKIEQSLGLKRIELPVIFFDGPLYKDEPEDLIMGARMGELSWKRNIGEDVRAFKDRLIREIKNLSDEKSRGSILLERDHSGLPEPSNDMPAYTPYPEVIKRLKEEGKI